MHFRSQKKSSQDVSLSDYIETGTDGTPLSLIEVISDEEDLLEKVSNRELVTHLQKAMDACLSQQERLVLRYRYGLDGHVPMRQREVSSKIGISRSYVFHHC